MERSEEDLRQFAASAQGVVDLATEANDLIAQEEYDRAGVRYGLIAEIAYAMAVTMQKAASNDLKARFFPKDMLEGLPTSEPDPGNYL